ncbi:MAG: response regulator [Phycisphaerales bacterium]|nr:response regulator [Phycisphaerales bacterium]
MTRDSHILLVEDNAADARLISELLKETRAPHDLRHVSDGVEALAYLRRDARFAGARRPDLIVLDLNLPRKDGRELLAEIKADDRLKSIPVVVLTTSQAEEDIQKAYSLNANCYVTKPVDLDQFSRVVKCIEDFWLGVAELPCR